MDLTPLTEPRKADLLISFIDIQNFAAITHKAGDSISIFQLIDSFAKIVIKIIEGTSGHIVKFIGDAALVIFPEDSVDEGVLTLKRIKDQCEDHLSKIGIPTKLRITAHFGEAAIGPLGEGKYRAIDVIGDSVNIASMLGRGEHRGRIVISPQAFRKLSPETRKIFHKHTPPVVYIVEE
jgi:class 3 adenylate cyclase